MGTAARLPDAASAEVGETINAALLQVRGLSVTYRSRRSDRSEGSGAVKAVQDVDLSVRRGETVALVGESGSGKTSVGLAVLNLVAATGSVLFDGQEVLGLKGGAMRNLRSRLQMVFQNPTSSLDPRMTVRRIVREPVVAHKLVARSMVDARVSELLETVALDPGIMDRYPHQLSGGQRQRVAIARALATSPDFVVCDEVTSSLDVSVQAQVVNLLMDLQSDLGLTMLFISHNLGVVRQLSHSTAVMYRGRIVESGLSTRIYEHAAHPYTRALLEAVPSTEPGADEARGREFLAVAGDLVEESAHGGCVYEGRCPFATELCRTTEPPLRPFSPEHEVACHLAEEIELGTAARAPAAR
jgi:oligopeptide/dipeptide ABC transporter ATP-binding protein